MHMGNFHLSWGSLLGKTSISRQSHQCRFQPVLHKLCNNVCAPWTHLDTEGSDNIHRSIQRYTGVQQRSRHPGQFLCPLLLAHRSCSLGIGLELVLDRPIGNLWNYFLPTSYSVSWFWETDWFTIRQLQLGGIWGHLNFYWIFTNLAIVRGKRSKKLR